MNLPGDLFFGIFIDDVSLYIADPHWYCAVRKLQAQLDMIYNWSIINHVTFRFKKFSVLDVGRRKFGVGNGSLDCLTFGDGHPPVEKQSKFLGLLVDDKMSFKPQIRAVTSRMHHAMQIMVNSSFRRSGVSPRRLMTMFYEFVFSRADYASCVWIFRIFFAVRLTSDIFSSDELDMNTPCARGYKTLWGKLNRAYMRCMKTILGAQSKASNIATLVRLGVMPLRYLLASRALRLYLKIINNEVDPLMREQWEKVSQTPGLIDRTSFYRGCKGLLARLNSRVEDDIAASSPSKRSALIEEAIFAELSDYWGALNIARVTHLVHPTWQKREVIGCENRHVTTIYHNLSLGKGPLRALLHRENDADEARKCRWGCGAEENLEHFLRNCRHIDEQRARLKCKLREEGIELNEENAFSREDTSIAMFSMIKSFFKVH
jgi:hypothetical protein